MNKDRRWGVRDGDGRIWPFPSRKVAEGNRAEGESLVRIDGDEWISVEVRK